MARALRTSLLIVLGVALAVATAAVWHTRERRHWFYTDADSIREAAARATVRDVLWQPAKRLTEVSGEGEDYEPRISEDGQTMFFVRGKAGENAEIWWAKRQRENWTEPQPLSAVNSPADDLGPEPSADGESLYFYSDREGGLGGYDLWVSRRGASGWEAPTNLGPAVNTSFNDYGPALTPDGSSLYFASNRPKPGETPPDPDRWPATIRERHEHRDYDLFLAPITERGVGEAARIEALSTPHNEGTPSISPVGDFVYFSSDRPGGLGGFDLYRSRRLRGGHEPPHGLGEAINSQANDLDPALSSGGFTLTFSSNRARTTDAGEPAKDYDLYRSYSREVFREYESTRATIDWASILPWLWWLLLLPLLALLAWLLWRARETDRFRRLDLLTRCLLASALLHALILLALAFWHVGNALDGWLRPSGGTRIAIESSAASDSVVSQILGEMTSMSAPPMAAIESARFERAEQAAEADPIQTAVPATRPPITVSRETAQASDAPAVESELPVERPPDTALVAVETAVPTAAPPARTSEAQPPTPTLPTAGAARPPETAPGAATGSRAIALDPAPAAPRGARVSLAPTAAAPDAEAPIDPAPESWDAVAQSPAGNLDTPVPTPSAGSRQSAAEHEAPVPTASAPQAAPPDAVSGEIQAAAVVAPTAARAAPLRSMARQDAAASDADPVPPAVPDLTIPAPDVALAAPTQRDIRVPTSSRRSAPAEQELRHEPSAPQPVRPPLRADTTPAPALAAEIGVPSTSPLTREGAGRTSASEAPSPRLPAPSSSEPVQDLTVPTLALGLPRASERHASASRGDELDPEPVLAAPEGPRPAVDAGTIRAAQAALAPRPAPHPPQRGLLPPEEPTVRDGLPPTLVAPSLMLESITVPEDAVGFRTPTETIPDPGTANPERTLSGFVVDAVTREPLAAARVRLDRPDGEALVVRTGPDGSYALRIGRVPEHLAVSASKRGYTPASVGLAAADLADGMRHDFALSPVERSTIALESDPQVHHLGDGEFAGRINSQFQKPCEGLEYAASFSLSPDQARNLRGTAELRLLAKGLQGRNEIRINGNLLESRLTGSPADGSYGTFRAQFPGEWLQQGENSLSIRSVHNGHDFDDFEFVNVRVLVSTSAPGPL